MIEHDDEVGDITVSADHDAIVRQVFCQMETSLLTCCLITQLCTAHRLGM